MKKMIISALIASMIAMAAVTGCGSSSAKPQEEAKEAAQEEQMMEQTEDVRDAEAPEASTADAAALDPATEDHAAAEMTAGPIETEEVSVFGTETAAETDEPGSVYPEFHYTGEDHYIETIWTYFQDNYSRYYEKKMSRSLLSSFLTRTILILTISKSGEYSVFSTTMSKEKLC